MPTDPSIILVAQAPQILSPQQQQASANLLRGQQQEQQLRAQAMQENEAKLLSQRRAVEGDELQGKLIAANTKINPDTGLTETDHQAVYQGLNSMKFSDRAEHYIANAPMNEKNAQAAQLAQVSLVHSLLKTQGDMLSSVLDAPPEQRAAAWQTQLSNLRVMFNSQPQLIKNIPAEYPGDEQAQQLANVGRSQEEKLKNALDAANAKKAASEAENQSAQAALARSKAAPVDPAKYQEQIDAIVPTTDLSNAGLRRMTMARVKNARTVEDADKALDEAAKQIGQIAVARNTVPYKIEVANGGVNFDGANGEVDPTVKAMAEYRIPPLSSFAMSKPQGQKMMKAVAAYNPEYDATKYATRQKTRTAYTTGTEGQQLNAINTAILHMDLLADAADALKNGDFKPGNAVYNKIADTFGAVEPNSYEGIKEFLDGEIGSAIKKGVATEGEMGRLSSKAGGDSAPAQLTKYIRNSMNILGGKASVLDDKYHSVMGPSDPFTAITPRSQSVLVKHGFNPSNFGASNPDVKDSGKLQANTTHQVKQDGVTYNVTTDASGKVISSVKVP